LQQQRIGLGVAGIAEQPRVVEADMVAHRKQQVARLLGQIGGERRIRYLWAHRSSIAEKGIRGAFSLT
jgi:hypothetical protein